MRHMSYEQFAKERGLVTDYDVQGHIHGGLMAAHMPNSYHRRYQKRLVELQAARAEGKRQYEEAIAAGEVAPWPELSGLDALKAKAGGHPDLPSVQSAKRLLDKRLKRMREAA